MFYFTYLRRELRRRMRQAIFIGIGLAVGIGLVITVIGASNGVKAAQGQVLRSLYGIGTDLTVTTKPSPPKGRPGTFRSPAGGGPGGGTGSICINGKCSSAKGGTTIDNLVSGNQGPIGTGEIAKISRLRGVTHAVGGLTLTDNRVVIPPQSSGQLPTPVTTQVFGQDVTHEDTGPLSNGRLVSGRAFKAADAHADVALVDENYAVSHRLRLGGTVTVAGVKFTIVGVVRQPQDTAPASVYIPLARAQALAQNPATGKTMANLVNTIYVAADSAADIARVQHEIAQLMPSATITSSATLASEVTGSLSSTAKLANDLGKWLAIVVLIAAFALACLLTMAAVSRRVREFGTLKALGWRSSRIVGQVLGESVVTGIGGGLAGVGLGFAGTSVIHAIAPKLTATVPSAVGNAAGPQTSSGGPVMIGGPLSGASTAHTTISVPLTATVTVTAIVLAVVLALCGGVIAGSFGGWRAARLRPADALRKVA
jgi:putative ABC transport system permease protein